MKQLKMKTILSMVSVLKYFVVTAPTGDKQGGVCVYFTAVKKIFLSNVEKTLKSYKKQLSGKYRLVVKKSFCSTLPFPKSK